MKFKNGNGDGSIWKTERNGKPYYKASVTIGKDAKGNLVRRSFGSASRALVRDKVTKALYEAQNNIYNNKDITFGNFFKEWIFKFKKNEVQPNTFSDYESTYRTKILNYEIHDIKLRKINTLTLQKYFNYLYDNQNVSANNLKRLYIKVKSCLEFARVQNIINSNFCAGVSLPRISKDGNKKIKVFTKEEQSAILKSLTDRPVDLLISFTFFTGLRLGEVLALYWDDIDDNYLHVKRQLQKNIEVEGIGKSKLTYVFKELKTKSSAREIPLPKQALKILSKIDKTDCKLIFNSNCQPIERKRPQRRLAKICKDLNITGRSFHSIRHTYATRLFELNIPIKTIQVTLGHSEISTTMDIYTHVMKDKKDEIINKFDDLD